jgi:hypothetical protein
VRRVIPESTWSEIRTAYASGIRLREIGRNMNIPEGTVLARAKREGWTRQIQSAKALAKRQDASLAVTPPEAVSMSMQQRGEILDSVDQIEKLDKVARRTFGLKDDNPYIGFSLNVLSLDSCGIKVGAPEPEQ